jgi:hypothetical protein
LSGAPPPLVGGVGFGGFWGLFFGFGVFFCLLLVLFWYCFATGWLLSCLRGSWGWFPGVFRVPFVDWRVGTVWMAYFFGGDTFFLSPILFSSLRPNTIKSKKYPLAL